MTTSDLIASLALFVTVVSLIRSEIKSAKNDAQQKVMKEEQDRLRKLLLEKEIKSAISDMKAELGARLVKIARNNYRLKVFNRGKVEALNVELEFPDNDADDYLSMHDVADKFPYQVLHPQQNIDVIAALSLGSKTKYRVRLVWDDRYKKRNTEEFIVSV